MCVQLTVRWLCNCLLTGWPAELLVGGALAGMPA